MVNTKTPENSAYKRLSKAQVEIGNISKNKKNPHFNSAYVDLAAVVESITPVLAENDLILRQYTDYLTSVTDEGVTVWGDLVLITEVLDALTGEEVVGMTYPLVCKDKSDPQKMGGALTYARRYSILTVVGAAPEDDDGNKAATPAKKGQSLSQKLAAKLKAEGVNDAEAFKKYTKKVLGVEVASTKDLSPEQIEIIVQGGVPF